jgi:hypothetical protein
MTMSVTECDVLLRVASEAMKSADAASLTEEQRDDWLRIATRSLQSVVRKCLEAERNGHDEAQLALLRGRVRAHVVRLERHGIVVDEEGRISRRP